MANTMHSIRTYYHSDGHWVAIYESAEGAHGAGSGDTPQEAILSLMGATEAQITILLDPLLGPKMVEDRGERTVHVS